LTRDELCAAGRTLYGRWGWQTRLAEALGVNGSTVRRWVAGVTPVPGPVAVAVRGLLENKAVSEERR
jgi:DNA-binding transcriptional regulator YdaS (Cro superfamily)